MSVLTRASDNVEAPGASALAASLDRLWAELPRISAIAWGSHLVGRLTDHAAALRFALHHGADRPLLVGLVGGASCGKSTLFDSLLGQTLSRIHYQPHSSLGPVVAVHRRYRSQLLAAPHRLFPQLRVQEMPAATAAVVGAPDTVVLAFHDMDRWQRLALIDMPDMSSESARREGWLVRRLLPWFDLVIWMVDPNDYLFEDLYIDPIDEVAALGQRSVVLVNDIHGQVESSNAVVRDRVKRFSPDSWFVLPRLQCSAQRPYPLFATEPEFIKLQQYLSSYRTARPVAPLANHVRRDVNAILHANSEWLRVSRELSVALTRLVARHRKRIIASAPLLSVLPERAREALERVRNRLSLWHQSKRLLRVLRSPALALGRAAVRDFRFTQDDLNTEPLFRYLVGSLKEFGVDLHRAYLESRLVRELQEQDSQQPVLGTFEPESLDFKPQLDRVAAHLYTGAQQVLSDPSLLRDRRFHFVAGTTGVAMVFLMVEATLGIPGVSLMVTKGMAALAGLLSPELARILPLDRMSRLAHESRAMLSAILDAQMQRMIEFYCGSHGHYLEKSDSMLALLETVRDQCGPVAEGAT